jgi:methylglyoxal synthase
VNPSIALVAHDARKEALVAWATRHRALLARHPIVATGTTGSRLVDALPELSLTRVKSGPHGGDLQIGAMIADGTVAALMFFIDPLTAQPHEVDVRALTRIAVLYDVPLALNAATADLLVQGFG